MLKYDTVTALGNFAPLRFLVRFMCSSLRTPEGALLGPYSEASMNPSSLELVIAVARQCAARSTQEPLCSAGLRTVLGTAPFTCPSPSLLPTFERFGWS